MSLIRPFGSKAVRLAVIATAALGLIAADAMARPGGNVGSRGSKTFSAPPPTATAPKTAQPIQKSITQPGPAQNAATAATASAAQAARPSLMRGLLLGGLMGAGLAMLFGSGPLSAVLGFLLQTLLIGGLVYLAVMFFRNRSGRASPAYAGATAGAGAAPQNVQNAAYRQAAGPMGGGAGGALNITGDDYGAFERLLGDIQRAYGRGDANVLGGLLTPEMLSYFASELEENRRKGVRNELGEPKLLQGDLSEAWAEQSGEYATVAMRYSLTDATIDQSGRVVAGSRTEPQEVTEIWTFRRDRGTGPNGWELSAIQQA